jgi:thymidylate kinase
MVNRLNVLCIDGILGIGKTSQVLLFCNLLKQHGILYKTFCLTNNSDQINEQLLRISDFLDSNPNGIAICDGSIATSLVFDMVDNMHRDQLLQKHENNLRLYEVLNSKYNFVSILLTPNNIEICEKRLKKQAERIRGEVRIIENKDRTMTVAEGLRQLDNNMIAFNIKFDNINLMGDENITQVHNKIIDIIKERYQIIKS